MNLKNLQIFPLGKTGWASDLLVFGENITQLYGPNGCGKTPLVQAMMFCLGYPSVFRQDIYDHCSHAILKVQIKDNDFIIKRVFSRDVDIEMTDSDGISERFFDEKSFSEHLFEIMGKRVSNLVTTTSKIGHPYLSSMLPIFYLDQDDGYNEYYCPPSKFIRDQFSEMVRMVFALPMKNSFDAKKAAFGAKEELKQLDTLVETTLRKVNIAEKQAASIYLSLNDITTELKELENDREQLKHSDTTHDQSINVYDKMIATRSKALRTINDEIGKIAKRKNSIAQIIAEINTEVETLNINEEARRVFLSFSEICDSQNCKLFSSSSKSYSKNLLYLKDQIKDLERNEILDSQKFEQLVSQKQEEHDQLKALVEERNNTVKENISSSIVDAISKIETRFFELQSQKSLLENLGLAKQEYVNVLIDRDKAIDRYESYSSHRTSNPKIIRLRADLRNSFLDWLDLINTYNISRDITFKDDFKPVLGNEIIKQLKGSTRTRAVLAYHAALIEQITKIPEENFNFFVLDTPKQHEIHIDDLHSYIKALKEFSKRTKTQIIFSTTEYHYKGDEFDEEWTSQYQGEKQKMFLRILTNIGEIGIIKNPNNENADG
jgi:hypothetical protein